MFEHIFVQKFCLGLMKSSRSNLEFGGENKLLTFKNNVLHFLMTLGVEQFKSSVTHVGIFKFS